MLADTCAKDGTTLTDGCGEISVEKATAISKLLGLTHIPSAFQVNRILTKMNTPS